MPDENIMRKIRGLLRQAESTNHEEEAALFLEKAQQLMMVYAIDQETLWATEPDKRPKPIYTNIEIGTNMTGSQWMRALLNTIAKNNRCRMFYTGSDCTVAGYENDVNFVEVLFGSIKVQMSLKQALAIADSGVVGQRTKTFRSNFIETYCRRVIYRMNLTEKQRTTSSNSKTLVLTRSHHVDAFVDRLLGGAGLRDSKLKSNANYDPQASMAGRKAADSTDISGGRNTLTSRKALPQ